MPLYEFECQSCESTVEVLVNRPDQVIEETCPTCEDGPLERVMSATAAPSVSGSQSLPMASPGEPCGAPRCCGGGCDI